MARPVYDDGTFIPTNRRAPVTPQPGNELQMPNLGSLFGSGSDPFAMFDDPGTRLLTDTIRNQLNVLNQPIVDPTRDAMMSLIAGRIPGMLSGGGGSGGNALLGDFVNLGRQRITELQQEPFSAGEEAAMKTRASEAVESSRSSDRERALEDIARRGLGESSGVLQERYADIDRGASASHATNARELLLAIAQERQRRKDAAVQIAQGLAGAGQSDAALRQGDAQLAFQRESGGLQLAKMLSDMSSGLRGEQDARRKEALGLTGLIADLPTQRLQVLMNVLNGMGGNNPASITNQIANLASVTGQQQQSRDQGQAAFMAALGQMLGYLGNRQ